MWSTRSSPRAAYVREIEATRHLIEVAGEQVQLATVQAQAGTAPYSTVLGLRAQLAGYEASIPQLQQKAAQSDDLLATLAGHAPAQWQAPPIDLRELTLPADLPLSVPSELVRQRPDILVAEATAHAASANIGVATAALLPSVTLNGSYGTEGLTTGTLFAASGRIWSAAGGCQCTAVPGRHALVPPQGGHRHLPAGGGAVSPDASWPPSGRWPIRCARWITTPRRCAAQDEALAAAQQAWQLLQINYDAGLATYLDVLTANAQYHQAQINDLQAIAMRYQDTVALYVALGGGWWNAQPPQSAPP